MGNRNDGWRKSSIGKGMCISMKEIRNRIWKDLKDFWPAILLFAIYNVAVRTLFNAFCPFLILTGFPCAGCGMTRAVFYILTGRIARGMHLNPAAPLWIAFIVWFFWNRYVCGIHKRRTTLWLGLVCAITLIIYIYRIVNYFPGDPPMVYYKRNIMNTFWQYLLHKVSSL